MEEQLRLAARRCLPSQIRRPLGTIAGKLNEWVIQGSLGLLFDLKGARLHLGGCTFIIPKDVTPRNWRACFMRDEYEHHELVIIPHVIQPEDRVIELGGCLGVVSCLTNKLLADKSKHLVVEANPLCIPALYRNRELNQAGFLIEHCAVDTKPEVVFYLHPRFIVGGTLQRPTNRPVRLPAKSLRQLERERGPFTVLIIDIEGSEREVFEDSVDLLKNYRLVIVELHDWAIGTDGVEKCRQILGDCGLELVERSGIVEAWRRKTTAR
jgi:FkbM family methyltransferase